MMIKNEFAAYHWLPHHHHVLNHIDTCPANTLWIS